MNDVAIIGFIASRGAVIIDCPRVLRRGVKVMAGFICSLVKPVAKTLSLEVEYNNEDVCGTYQVFT